MSCLLILILSLLLLLRHVGGAEYCDRFVCLCVCRSVHWHISGTPGPIYTKFYVQIPCVHGSVLLWGRYATLCTSGLWMTSRLALMGTMPKHGGCTLQQLPSRVAIPGLSLISMNACFEWSCLIAVFTDVFLWYRQTPVDCTHPVMEYSIYIFGGRSLSSAHNLQVKPMPISRLDISYGELDLLLL